MRVDCGDGERGRGRKGYRPRGHALGDAPEDAPSPINTTVMPRCYGLPATPLLAPHRPAPPRSHTCPIHSPSLPASSSPYSSFLTLHRFFHPHPPPPHISGFNSSFTQFPPVDPSLHPSSSHSSSLLSPLLSDPFALHLYLDPLPSYFIPIHIPPLSTSTHYLLVPSPDSPPLPFTPSPPAPILRHLQ